MLNSTNPTSSVEMEGALRDAATIQVLKDRLTAFVRDKSNTFSAAGVFNSDGELVPSIKDGVYEERSESEQEDYYQTIGSRCRGIFSSYAQLRPTSDNRMRAIEEDVGDLEYISMAFRGLDRRSKSEARRIAVALPLDDAAQFFLAVVAWNASSWNERANYSALMVLKKDVEKTLKGTLGA